VSSTLPASLSDAELGRFCAFFYRRTGIAFPDSRLYYVEKHLTARLAETGTAVFADYLARLRAPGGEAELERLINGFTVNETYFYREAGQFETLVSFLLPELTAQRPPGAHLRILSLPCATGEEPYSLALYLLEHWPDLAAWEVELLAGDIDTAALTAARAGIYTARALERLPDHTRRRYFTPAPGGRFQLCKPVREAVHFHHINVTSPRDMQRYRDIHVLFCRNMLIYFDDASRRETMRLFYEALAPGGFICLGHSESMSRISGLFAVRAFARAVVYQKPLEAP
jgi:chemotaxis protein methyltransferase CheR